MKFLTQAHVPPRVNCDNLVILNFLSSAPIYSNVHFVQIPAQLISCTLYSVLISRNILAKQQHISIVTVTLSLRANVSIWIKAPMSLSIASESC